MSLDELRKQIDDTDRELVRLLEQRYRLVEQVAVQKAEEGIPVLNRNREEEVINSVNGQVQNRKYAEYIVDTFCGIMDISKQYQNHYLENIVLIGMPGCGKTTIGREYAKQYGYSFIDADEEFERINGISPAEYIREHGEKSFRDEETKVLESFKPMSRCVFALGGGVVTVQENFELVKPLGLVIYLTRDVGKLAIQGRPLSQDRGVDTLYAERADLYELWADVVIANDDPAKTIARIAAI